MQNQACIVDNKNSLISVVCSL